MRAPGSAGSVFHGLSTSAPSLVTDCVGGKAVDNGEGSALAEPRAGLHRRLESHILRPS